MEIFFELLQNNSLETRLKVSNEIAFANLLSELGFRNGAWTKEEDEMLGKLCQFADLHTKRQLAEIEQWKKDGEPK